MGLWMCRNGRGMKCDCHSYGLWCIIFWHGDIYWTPYMCFEWSTWTLLVILLINIIQWAVQITHGHDSFNSLPHMIYVLVLTHKYSFQFCRPLSQVTNNFPIYHWKYLCRTYGLYIWLGVLTMQYQEGISNRILNAN